MGTDLTRHSEVEAALWRSLSVTPAAREVAVGPVAVGHHVREVGSGPPVVFVHGTSVSGACFAPLVAALHDRRCLVVDRPGCGFSDRWPEPIRETASFETCADRWLVELLDALELDAATIVSTSFGGLFALRAVAAHPDRFVAVKHLAWSAGAPIAHVPLVMRVAAVPSIGRLMNRLPLPRFVARSMLKQIGLGGALAAGRIGDEFFEWFRSIATDTDTIRNEIDSLPAVTNLRHGLNEDLLLSEELLGSIRRPIEFLWGGDDPMGGVDIAERFVAKIPGATLEVLDGAGHAPWVDDPERAAAFVRASPRTARSKVT
jgi:pimeloyl-ACP methyl ester carboxylesterase